MPITSLGEALKSRMAHNQPLKQQAQAGALIVAATSVLKDFVGEENMKYVKPLFVKNRTLTLTCSNSALSQEIHLNQAKIVEQINTALGQNVLDRLRYLL